MRSTSRPTLPSMRQETAVLAGSDDPGDGTHPWQLIAHPRAQMRLEFIGLVAMYPAFWVAWLIGLDWFIVAGTSALMWSTLRLLNRRNYGVWVRPGQIDLRGPISSKVIPAKAISKLVIVDWRARLEVVAGRALCSGYVGLAGWSRDEQHGVLKSLDDWAESENIDAPFLTGGGFVRPSVAILGPALGAVRYPRKPIRLPTRTWLMTAALATVHVVVGFALYRGFVL